VSLVALAVAAALLAVERACYVVISRAPRAFRELCARGALAGGPVAVVERLFYAFKALQLSVFAAWCYVHGDGSLLPAHDSPLVCALASALIVAGQVFVIATFYRLGRVGVFFGDRLGYRVERCREFPFSVLAHPQYVGTIVTVWGLFFAMRFPQDDWYGLPVLETVYYAAGAWLEEPRALAQGLRKKISPMKDSARERVSLESMATDTAPTSSPGAVP
jgi:phosphatidyl-N-methylethanolamine N-methyltransferase